MKAQRIPEPDEIAAISAEIRAEPGFSGETGGPRLLLAAVLAYSVEALDEWCTVRSNPKTTGREYLAHFAVARKADAWLQSDEPSPAGSYQLTFNEVCDFLDLNPEAARERIYRRFPSEALMEIRV
jgi:hypothetical protein